MVYYTDYVAGGLGGAAGLFFGYPMDTVKVRQQIGTTKVNSIIQCVYDSYRRGGISGFYRGLSFPMVAEGFRNVISFGVYGTTMKLLDTDKGRRPEGERLVHVALAGTLAGIAQSAPAIPIELVKIKLQAQVGSSAETNAQKLYKGPVDCFRHILKEHGVRACFRGGLPLLLRDGSAWCAYMLTFEYLCHMFRKRGADKNPVYEELVFGGLAGVISWLNMPLDVMKTRMQEDSLSKPRYKGMWDCVSQIYKCDGFRAFWRGLPVACMRAFPVNAVTFAVRTECLVLLERRHRRSD